jgi:hypothetical protein
MVSLEDHPKHQYNRYQLTQSGLAWATAELEPLAEDDLFIVVNKDTRYRP